MLKIFKMFNMSGADLLHFLKEFGGKNMNRGFYLLCSLIFAGGFAFGKLEKPTRNRFKKLWDTLLKSKNKQNHWDIKKILPFL